MVTESLSYSLDNPLSLQTPDGLLTIETNLSVSSEENQIKECFLRFSVPPEQFQDFQSKQLFNLKPEMIGATKKSFDSQLALELTAKFNTQLLGNLPANTDFKNYLLNLDNQSPLLQTENWFIVSVKQSQADGEVNYQTLWSYLDPEEIGSLSGTTLVDIVMRFLQEQTNTDSSIVEVVGEAMKDWFKQHHNLTNLEVISPEKMISNVISILESFTENSEVLPSESHIFSLVLQFFQEHNWFPEVIKEQAILRVSAQANNGDWFCYAEIREEQKQFRFYSVCPIKAPPERRMAIAEFITRANYGLSIGNFELDFADGEVRYKTSIDVEGSQLDLALIRQLIYPNLTTMDEYLPGLMKIIYSDISPKEAIAEIER
ncbi:YbjN domain-containing protein [Microcoleus sp. D3_18a_C4]|uniref:YbjN domain-containing protein n=1 Tax=Microcoleus sp. D3_18a_C4 TaxID=3055332 RepID=UPI002FD1C486